MSIGTWDPNSSEKSDSFTVEPEILDTFIDFIKSNTAETFSPAKLTTILSSERLERQKPLMKLAKERWFAVADTLSDQDLIHLIRFFTLAEMKLPGWEAGAASPVIWLVKVLRKRGTPPERELLLWIKANSTNKYLPNGPLNQ